MRIAICDDEKQICEFLKEKIRRYYFSNDINFSIQTFENGEKLLESDLNLIDGKYIRLPYARVTCDDVDSYMEGDTE